MGIISRMKWYCRLIRRLDTIKRRLDTIEKRFFAIERRFDDIKFYNNLYPFSPEEENKSPAYRRFSRLHGLLHLQDVAEGQLIRTGRPHDGGYLMLDEFKPGMLAYSFGICDDVSWDKSMVERGIECFMYDHTIESLPEEHPLFHWHKEGICGAEPVDDCRTLADFIKINGHENRNDLILKMDVEGAEWDALAATSSETLSQFSQIAFELHDVYSSVWHGTICNILSKLNETHQPVWVHRLRALWRPCRTLCT